MTEHTIEDRKVARQILDFQRLLYTDMLVAFPDGIQRYHLTALTWSFLEMLLKIEEPALRRRMWEIIQAGIEHRFSGERL